MINKKNTRLRRSKRTRSNIQNQNIHRLCVHRTLQHIYAQLISPEGNIVIASASTLEKEIRNQYVNGGNVEAAKKVGEIIAERILQKNIKKVAFDRSGFKYHGRIKALAEAARNAGLDF